MSQPSYLWNPPPVYSLPVRGKKERVPINRLFFVGRNYHAHAVEMVGLNGEFGNGHEIIEGGQFA